MKPEVSLLLVDDETDLIEELEFALTSEDSLPFRIQVVGEAHNGKQAIEMATRYRPDLILMDLVMPGGPDGVETALALRDLVPSKIILYSGYIDKASLDRISEARIWGYVVKSNLYYKLLQALQSVYEEKFWFQEEALQMMMKLNQERLSTVNQPNQPFLRLGVVSEKERQILELLMEGLSRNQIAAELKISKSSVSTYLNRIAKKAGLTSVSELHNYKVMLTNPQTQESQVFFPRDLGS